ncbi:MAG: AAA family ATPase, partial [Halanaerobiales bacterium]
MLKGYTAVREKRSPGLIFVSGHSGTGKTTLVKQLKGPVEKQGGLFLQGKYEQYMKNTPYSSLIQAMDIFFQRVLVQEKEELNKWSDRVLQALGDNAGIISSIFPALEKIIGPQKQPESLSFTERQNRIQRTFITFLQTISSKEQPLVIFLDDLQWADSSTINILNLPLSGIKDIYILFIVAYRDNELEGVEYLKDFIESYSNISGKSSVLNKVQKNTHINTVKLKHLNSVQVKEIIKEMFTYSNEEIDILSGICHEKSRGNLFYLNQFLNSLQEEGAIHYNSEENKWKVNLEQLLNFGQIKTINDLLLKKINILSDGITEILKVAACINNSFNSEIISDVLGIKNDYVNNALEEAVLEGFLVHVEKARDQGQDRDKEHSDRDCLYHEYSFFHDRIQQAVYSLITEKERESFHYQIAMYLLKNQADYRENRTLFKITEHFNSAENVVIKNDKEKLLIKLNLESGVKSKKYLAYDRALEYLERGIDLVTVDGWNNQYSTTLAFYTEAAETAYLLGKYDLMERYCQPVLEKGKELLDKIKVYEIQIEYLTTQNRLAEAIQLARKALGFLGIKIPEKPSRLDIIIKYLQIRFAMVGKKVEMLKNLPDMKDEKILTIMRILIRTGTAAYTYSEMIMTILILNVVQISLKHGIAPMTPVAFASYGHFLSAFLKKRERGYLFGKVAIDIQSSLESKTYECLSYMTFEILVRHNKEHINKSLEGFPHIYQKGLESGDLSSAGHMIMQHFVYMFMSGKELKQIKKEFNQYWGELLSTGDKISIFICKTYRQVIENLSNTNEKPWKLSGCYYTEKDEIQDYSERNYTFKININFNKMMLAYLSGDIDKALDYSEKAWGYKEGAIGTYLIPLYYFYSTLIRLKTTGKRKSNQMNSKIPFLEKFKSGIIIRRYLRELKGFYRDSAENYENKYFLVRAEYLHKRGKYEKALINYNRAIQAAKKYGFTQEEALANELAAEFLVSTGQEDLAEEYIANAVFSYLKWGCPWKAEELQQKYSDLFSKGKITTVTEKDTHNKDTDNKDIHNDKTNDKVNDKANDKANDKQKVVEINNRNNKIDYRVALEDKREIDDKTEVEKKREIGKKKEMEDKREIEDKTQLEYKSEIDYRKEMLDEKEIIDKEGKDRGLLVRDLDIETIVKASQTISGEVVFEELLKKMIHIVLQNAGARQAFFIMDRGGKLIITAEGTSVDREVMVYKGINIQECP